jgi:4-carboxymuconolactone decarboxylase
MDDALKETTRRTARMLFHSIKSGVGFETWKKFDKDLARELSMFFTGKLYSREVISQKQRELCAVASLTVLNRRNEVRAHIQQVTYGGMPVVVEALDVFKEVLVERGEWQE